MGGDPGDPRPSPTELDEEQHVEGLERQGVDGEEVRRHDALGLGTQECPPGRSGSARCGAEASVLHDPSDGLAASRTPSFSSSPWIRR